MDLYPDDVEQPDGSMYPGLSEEGKFQGGDAQQGIKASALPPATLNLILDNLGGFIKGVLGEINNVDIDQLTSAVRAASVHNSDHLEGLTKAEVLDPVWPVGATYIQFPGDLAPDALGLPGTWANVSSELAGDFIRFEGGLASAFGSGQQSDAGQRLTGLINPGASRGFAGSVSGVFTRDTSESLAASGSYGTGGTVFFDSQDSISPNPAKTNDYETRAVNRTVRKWRREA